jgi:hypothetical protein
MKPFLAHYRPRVIPETVTRIVRTLPGEGKLQVTPGEKVTSSDVLAHVQVSLGFHSFNLAKELGVFKGSAPNFLQKKPGEHIFHGELLARRNTLLGKKDVLSPTDAVIGDYSKETGMLKLLYAPKDVAVTSGVYGVIEQVNAEKKEVTIKTMARIVWGAIGVGHDRGGTLTFIGEPGSLFDGQKISSDLSQKILVTGALAVGEAYHKAELLRVAGIITGGINVRDFKAMAGDYDITREAVLEPEISVLATEGFGTLPIGEDIYLALKEHEGRFIFLNGKHRRILLPSNDPDSIMAVNRAELPPKYEPENINGTTDLVVGLRVRIIWPPFAGYVGKITAIDATPTVLESGIATNLVVVETKSRKVKVPYNNLEII